jgi:hypothetical protein
MFDKWAEVKVPLFVGRQQLADLVYKLGDLFNLVREREDVCDQVFR